MPEPGKSNPTRLSAVERRTLLSHRLNELPTVIQHSHLEALVKKLYDELEAAGIDFKPRTYLSDEWGCPNRIPVIAVPFYLSDTRLSRLVSEFSGSPVENDQEIMLYLRHEAGHAFNYAYRLYTEPEWRKLFGRFSAPYPEHYPTSPFSPRFVRHIPGWYAQKHPDEDFAESFAVWLTPGSKWREKYADTPAMAKLLYVEKAVHRFGQQPPLTIDESTDRPIEQLDVTLTQWCQTSQRVKPVTVSLPKIVNKDLRDLFPAAEGKPAADFLQKMSLQLLRDVHAWTGLDSDLLHVLIQELVRISRDLDLRVGPGESANSVARLAIFITTLAMNYQKSGKFVET